jgi:hypothetical protein
MPSLWDTITSLFQQQGTPRVAITLLNDHISPVPAQTGAAEADKSYFRLWATQMLLRSNHNWFQTLYPVVQSVVTFGFGDASSPVEVAQIGAPSHLQNMDASHLDRVLQLDYALTPLVPFKGGTVQVQAALLAMQASDLLQRFLDALGNFSSLLAVPQFSTALSIARPVSQAVESLINVPDKSMVLGYQQTFEGAGGGGGNELLPAYMALIDAGANSYPAERLWLSNGTLQVGEDAASAQPLAGVDFLLLRLETRSSRDDWDSLSSIHGPFARAIEALGQTDTSGQPKVADADAYVRSAAVAALASPDLTDTDRFQVARAIADRYKAYKTALGLDGGSAAVSKGLAFVTPPTLAEVARQASTYDAHPTTLGDLFA